MAYDAHDQQPFDAESAVPDGTAAEQPTHDHAGGGTSGWRRVRPRWYIAAGIAILAVVGVVIGVLASGSSPVTTGMIGETLHLSAANANATTSTVPVDVAVLNPPSGEGGSTVQVRLINTSSTETAQIANPAFVAVDDSGTWTAPSSATLLSGAGGEIGPGQTITGTLVFPGVLVTQVLFDPGGFVVDSNGNPIKYPSEIHGTWNPAN